MTPTLTTVILWQAYSVLAVVLIAAAVIPGLIFVPFLVSAIQNMRRGKK